VTRSAGERMADVRRLLAAAGRLHRDRARLVPGIARSTGLTSEGVELGFEYLERDATDADLRALVEAAGSTAHVHVLLSANVFVAPLRAIAIARAAAERVTVRPSRRDPVLAIALVDEVGDDAIRVVGDRDVAALDCTEIHVYGRDETVTAVRARARPGVTVRGHGAGLGVAMISEGADLERAAELVAPDVVAFDQRGCLSPRVALVMGSGQRAAQFAEALDRRLREWGDRVPRGTLVDEERAEAARWQETMRFAGHLWSGAQHAVGLGMEPDAVLVPPAGRHVFVGSSPSWETARVALGPIARFVVVVGSDAPEQAKRVAPPGARTAELGRMQRPPLDGPVDARESQGVQQDGPP
jgi:hypothetical protein